MPRKSRLKVYRTPIGFHDAYVAAPSQKAALAAWGSDADLFARGVAELVTDPELAAEPLARPGEVVKRSRGTAAEQIAALPPDRPATAKADEKAQPSKAKPPARRTPRPDRAPVDKAERALQEAREQHRHEERALASEAAALDRRRRAMEEAHRKAIGRLEEKRDRARDRYEAALRRWRG